MINFSGSGSDVNVKELSGCGKLAGGAGQGWEWQLGEGLPLGEWLLPGCRRKPRQQPMNPGKTNQLSPMHIGGQPVKAAKKNIKCGKPMLFLLSLAATINNVDETEESDFDISIPDFWK